ncbi:hypothetical protein U1Q18_037329, partial [Sarracenia purpurea var. burkii]
LKINDILEGYIARVLTYLDPPKIFKLERINRSFRGATFADFIWETKLPSNYRYIVDILDDEKVDDLGKKYLYARLCQPNRFNDRTKVIWIDKRTSRVCLSTYSKALSITGMDDRRCWNRIPTDESRL